MESGARKKPAPVTELVWMLGQVFGVTRRGGALDVRKLPKPHPQVRRAAGTVLRMKGRGE